MESHLFFICNPTCSSSWSFPSLCLDLCTDGEPRGSLLAFFKNTVLNMEKIQSPLSPALSPSRDTACLFMQPEHTNELGAAMPLVLELRVQQFFYNGFST